MLRIHKKKWRKNCDIFLARYLWKVACKFKYDKEGIQGFLARNFWEVARNFWEVYLRATYSIYDPNGHSYTGRQTDAGNENTRRPKLNPRKKTMMHETSWSTSVQVMACRMLGVKSLPEHIMRIYIQLHFQEHILMNWFKTQIFSFKKIHLITPSENFYRLFRITCVQNAPEYGIQWNIVFHHVCAWRGSSLHWVTLSRAIMVVSLLQKVHDFRHIGPRQWDWRLHDPLTSHKIGQLREGRHSTFLKFLTMHWFHWRTSQSLDVFRHVPLTRYATLRVAHAPGMPGTFSPPATSKQTAG